MEGNNSTDSTATPEPEVARSVKGNARRNSLAPSAQRNYLRASTGSCHDFCKFGKAHSVECKPRIPLQRRAASKSADDQVFARIDAPLPEINEKVPPSLRSRSVPTSKSLEFDDDIANARKEKPLQPDRKKPFLSRLLVEEKKEKSVLKPTKTSLGSKRGGVVPAQTKERRLSGTPITSPLKSITRRLSSNLSLVNNPRRSLDNGGTSVGVKKNKRLSSSSSSSLHSTLSVDSNMAAVKGKGIGTEVLKKVTGPLTASLSSKSLIMGKRGGGTLKNVDDPRLSSGKRMIPQKEANKEKKVTEDVVAFNAENEEEEPEVSRSLLSTELADQEPNNENGFETFVCTEIPVSPVTAMSIPSSPVLSCQEEDQMAEEEEEEEEEEVEEEEEMNSSSIVSFGEEEEEEETEHENGPPETSTSSELPVFSSQPDFPGLSLQQEEDEMVVLENTALRSDTAEYSASDFDEMGEKEEVPEQTRVARTRATAIRSEDVDAKPVKLRFKRGKILELQQPEGNDALLRRLRFRRRKSLGENQDDANAATSTLKKIMDMRREVVEGGDYGSLEDRSAKVVLRRRSDRQEKKDGQALSLNNVIEETASKLVETRKSKVKALVGAFETVMSRSDNTITKPPPSSSSSSANGGS